MDSNVEFNQLLERYHQMKIITIRELHWLGYSAREISRLMGGSNKDIIAKILKGETDESIRNITN